MKKGCLPIGWVRWRRRRYQVLSSQGLSSHLAWAVAKGEAKGRHRIAAIVGNKAARDAELEIMGAGEDVRFVLTGNLAGLTDAQLGAINRMNCQPK